MSDEPSATGLIRGVENREIKIIASDSEWPQRFETHAKVIAAALGGSALRIEKDVHVHVYSAGCSEIQRNLTAGRRQACGFEFWFGG